MSGPDNGTGGKGGFPLRGCGFTLALAALLLVVALLFKPVAPSVPARLTNATTPLVTAPGAPIAINSAKPGSGPQFPALTGRVVDAANILPADMKARLDQKLTALEKQSRRQLVVATIPDLQGYDIADYGYQLGRAWGIGDKQRNDGALLIVAPKDRKLRIEVGYGLEGVLTDSLSTLIIQQTILPKARAGDLPDGIEAGADALITQLTLPEAEARKVAAEASRPQAAEGGFPLGTIIFMLFILFFFILPLIRSMRGGRRYSRGGMGPVIIWPGGDFGGGGGFGGGFGGGGGSFGGGGSSGSW